MPGLGITTPQRAILLRSAKARFEIAQNHLAVPVVVHEPAVTASYVVEAADLAVSITIHEPILAYLVAAEHLTVVITGHAPSINESGIVAEHLTVDITIHDPSLAALIAATHLAVEVTGHSPAIVAEQMILPPMLEVSILGHPPGFEVEQAWFLPPNDPELHVPRWPRLHYVGNTPHSARYRMFLRNERGVDITINGRLYRGGYWHGPLTAEEMADIVAAGHGDRIIHRNETDPWPATVP